MANIDTYLQAILSAVYSEDVRGSIHDAIDLINKVGEKTLSVGTSVKSQSSTSQGIMWIQFTLTSALMMSGSVIVVSGCFRVTSKERRVKKVTRVIRVPQARQDHKAQQVQLDQMVYRQQSRSVPQWVVIQLRLRMRNTQVDRVLL